MKINLGILNTILTIIFAFLLMGFIGILISFIPDIMLIFLLKDLYRGKDKDRLTGIKLKIHLLLHSITLLIIYSFVGIIMIVLLNLNILEYYIKIILIFIIHIGLDYLTHGLDDNKFFIGFYPFYPSKRIKILRSDKVEIKEN